MFHYALPHALVGRWLSFAAPAGTAPAKLKLGLISEGTNTWPLYVAQAPAFSSAHAGRRSHVVGSSMKPRGYHPRDYESVSSRPTTWCATGSGSDLVVVRPRTRAGPHARRGSGRERIEDMRGERSTDGARTATRSSSRMLFDTVCRGRRRLANRGSQERFDS